MIEYSKKNLSSKYFEQLSQEMHWLELKNETGIVCWEIPCCFKTKKIAPKISNKKSYFEKISALFNTSL